MRQKSSDHRQLLATTVLKVRSGRASSRTSLAHEIGISASTMGQYVDQLIVGGYLHESGLEHGRMGRPKRTLLPRRAVGWFAGVECNAERVQVVGVDFAGQALPGVVRRLPAKPTVAEVMAAILELLESMVTRQLSPLLGIGVGAPGLVDSSQGVALRYNFVQDWNQVPIAAELQRRFRVPVLLENNLRVIALAERWFGSERELEDFVILGPRSGFGVAIVQGGQLLRGANQAAGELGLWPWPLGGNGHAQELHCALSANATYRRLAGLAESAPSPDNLRQALGALNGRRSAVWDQVVADYARVIGCVQLLLDPQMFFLHGPLTGLGPAFCEAIMQAAPAVIPALDGVPLKVVPSMLGDEAGALGAASLSMEAWVPEGC